MIVLGNPAEVFPTRLNDQQQGWKGSDKCHKLSFSNLLMSLECNDQREAHVETGNEPTPSLVILTLIESAMQCMGNVKDSSLSRPFTCSCGCRCHCCCGSKIPGFVWSLGLSIFAQNWQVLLLQVSSNKSDDADKAGQSVREQRNSSCVHKGNRCGSSPEAPS